MTSSGVWVHSGGGWGAFIDTDVEVVVKIENERGLEKASG